MKKQSKKWAQRPKIDPKRVIQAVKRAKRKARFDAAHNEGGSK